MAEINIEDYTNLFTANINVEKIKKKTTEYLKSCPGFFTPFSSAADVAATVVAPVIAPLGLGTITALLAVASALSAAVCISSLAVAGIGAIADQTDVRNSSLTVATISGIIAVVAPLVSVIAALLAVVASSVALTYLLSRTGATIVSSIDKAVQFCFSKEKVEEPEPESEVDPMSMVP